MSAHDWPEFDQLMPNGKLLTEREFVGLTRAQYNYAKVRIDACAGIPTSVLEANSAHSKILTASDIVALRMHHTEMMELRQQRDALQQRCEELVDIAHECQKIIKELCACYSHHEPIATLERIEAIKQVQP